MADQQAAAELMVQAVHRDGGRLIASLTTIPTRMNTLRQSLESIFSQSVLFDAVVVAVPDSARRWPGQLLQVPQWLLDDARVTIVRGRDWGPATKLIPALVEVATEPQDVIITFDDDDYYYPDVAANLVCVWQLMRAAVDACVYVCMWVCQLVYVWHLIVCWLQLKHSLKHPDSIISHSACKQAILLDPN
jgi:hypothetical protein